MNTKQQSKTVNKTNNFESDKRLLVIKHLLENPNLPPHLAALKQLSDEELVKTMDFFVLPNSVSTNALKYNYFFARFGSKRAGPSKEKKIKQELEHIDKVLDVIDTQHLSVLKYGLFYGYPTDDWRYYLSKFVKAPIGSGVSRVSRVISSYSFQRAFAFSRMFLLKAINNDKFPKI